MTKKNPTLARTLLALAVLALASYSLASASPSEEVMAYDDDGRGQHQQVKITNVPGYFVQDLDETDPALFDYVSPLQNAWKRRHADYFFVFFCFCRQRAILDWSRGFLGRLFGMRLIESTALLLVEEITGSCSLQGTVRGSIILRVCIEPVCLFVLFVCGEIRGGGIGKGWAGRWGRRTRTRKKKEEGEGEGEEGNADRILEEYYGKTLWDVSLLLSRVLQREGTDIWHRFTGRSWMGTGRFLGSVGPSVRPSIRVGRKLIRAHMGEGRTTPNSLRKELKKRTRPTWPGRLASEPACRFPSATILRP